MVEIHAHVSPDPKVKITTSGNSAVTFRFNGTGWTHTIGSTTTPWSTGDPPIEITTTANITVVDNSNAGNGSMTHADMLKFGNTGRPVIVPQKRARLDENHQAILQPPTNASVDEVFEIVMDDLVNLSGAFVSGWTPDDLTGGSHTTSIPHDLGHVPNMITVWFSNDRTAQYPILWSWTSSQSINPVTIRADNENVYLGIWNGIVQNSVRQLHGVWEPTRWILFPSGYWRIVVS